MDVQDVCIVTAGDRALRINLLILLDTSGSLRTTDPGNLRSAGTSDALQVIEGLSLSYPEDANIEVALDTFDASYSRQAGWYAASEVYSRLGDSVDKIATDSGPYTDYGAALTDAWRERFTMRANDCNLLIWFTDGEHATAEDEAGEQRQLVELCSSPAMQSLRDHVWVGAVQLREGESEASRLRYLYGQASPADASLRCINPLRGEIYDSFDADRLNTVLRELIETVIGRTPQPPEEPMPDPVRPPQPELDEGRCTGGDGSPSDPCIVFFDLDPGIESFRAFVDLTFIGREIENPDDVLAVVRAPDGTTSPSIGVRGDIRPREQTGRYLPVNPFGFFTRSNYPSDLQIVGHQAAEQLANSNQWQWQWEGEWSVLFFGDTPAAQEDARRAAAAVRVQREDSPFVDSFGIDDRCSVSGFVANYPTDNYSDVELRLRVDAGDGEPVYPTRQSLTGEPLVAEPDTRRFALPDIFGELVHWDSPDRGGNGTNLRDALTQRGGVALVAVLSQTFTYAGAPEPLVWARDIGRLDLTGREASYLLDVTDGRSADHLFCLPLDSGVRWLPTDVALGDPQHDWSGAAFAVSAVAGELPATLSLAAAGVELVEQDSDTGVAAATGVAVDNAEWTCEVPAAAGDTSRFTCPEPISIEVSADQPFMPTMKLGIPLIVTESSGSAVRLLERLGYQTDSAGYGARSEALAEALGRERRSVLLAAELDPIIDPATRWLPSDFLMEPIDLPHAIDVKSILVSASPGELPALAHLQSVRLVPESESASPDARTVDVGPWACAIPGSASVGGRFACTEQIAVAVPADRDVELSLVPKLCPAEAPESINDLLERFGVPAETPDFETLKRLIEDALERERDCVEAATSVPPTPDSVLLKFLPMLAALIAAAAAARFWSAWRLRPWQPLDSPDYAVLPLDSEDEADATASPVPLPSQMCMDLQQRKAVTSIEGVRLRSLWAPLLRGAPPALRASSTSGDCIGPAGHKRHRSSRAQALIGPDLVRGWVVHNTEPHPRVIVWDLPFDSDDIRRDRITDAARDAAPAWKQFRASAATGVPAPGDSETAGAADATETDLTEPDPALQDPFFDDADHQPGDNGQNFDDADPFGRDS